MTGVQTCALPICFPVTIPLPTRLTNNHCRQIFFFITYLHWSRAAFLPLFHNEKAFFYHLAPILLRAHTRSFICACNFLSPAPENQPVWEIWFLGLASLASQEFKLMLRTSCEKTRSKRRFNYAKKHSSFQTFINGSQRFKQSYPRPTSPQTSTKPTLLTPLPTRLTNNHCRQISVLIYCLHWSRAAFLPLFHNEKAFF